MKKSLLLVIKILVSGGLLYLIMLKVDLKQLIISFSKGNFVYLTYGLLFGCIFNMIKFLRWRNLIRVGEGNVYSYGDAVKSYMIGNSLGLITPLRAGDLGRALYFASVDRSRIMGLTVIDRVMDISAVLVLSIGGSFYLINKEFGIFVTFLAVLCFIILFSQALLWTNVQKVIPAGRFWEKIIKLIDILKNLDTETISIALILSFLAFAIVLCQFYFLLSAFEGASFTSVFMVTPLITLSSIIPVSFMGLGVREGISILLFSKFGISGATALSAAFLGFVMNNVLISLIGIFFLSKIGLTRRN